VRTLTGPLSPGLCRPEKYCTQRGFVGDPPPPPHPHPRISWNQLSAVGEICHVRTLRQPEEWGLGMIVGKRAQRPALAN